MDCHFIVVEGEYMAFGLSGSGSSSVMSGSDVITAYYDTNEAHAIDYKITAYAQVGRSLLNLMMFGGNTGFDLLKCHAQGL